MSAHHAIDLLGKALRDLAPLVTAAVQALDKPGSRALRRKLDGRFNFAVSLYGGLQRMGVPECDWPALDTPRYERATEVWPGQVVHDAKVRRREAEAAGERQQGRLRLAVDNAPARRPVEASTLGGAA
jgi:hypothetical protein